MNQPKDGIKQTEVTGRPRTSEENESTIGVGKSKIKKPKQWLAFLYITITIGGFYLFVTFFIYLLFWAGRPEEVSLKALFGSGALATPIFALLYYLGAFNKR